MLGWIAGLTYHGCLHGPLCNQGLVFSIERNRDIPDHGCERALGPSLKSAHPLVVARRADTPHLPLRTAACDIPSCDIFCAGTEQLANGRSQHVVNPLREDVLSSNRIPCSAE